jgi:hypothetical protein
MHYMILVSKKMTSQKELGEIKLVPYNEPLLVSLLRGTITGPLGSCLDPVRSFLAGWRMGFLMGTYALDSLQEKLEENACPWESYPFLAGYTGPATGADTSRKCDLPNQP